MRIAGTELPVNVIRTASGKLRPVCEFCGKLGRAAAPLGGGDRLTLWDVARGWGEVPYPPDFVHEDGSRGSLWRCPACERRMDRGEALYGRLHVHDWMTGGVKWSTNSPPCRCGAVTPEPPF